MLPALLLLAAQSLPAAAPLAAPTPEPDPAVHVEQVEHHGVAYAVTYRPILRITTRTVGAHVGPRPSLQRCRALTEIAVEREVRLADGSTALAHRLAETRRSTAYHAGPCEQHRRTLAAARERAHLALAAEVRALAAADRPALLAQIDAARSLAVN